MNRLKLFILVLGLFSFIVSGQAKDNLSWDDCVVIALKNNPELIVAKEAVEQAKNDRTIFKAVGLPQISARASSRNGENDGESSESYSYGLSGQQLIFDGFKTSNNLAASAQNLNAQEYEQEVVLANIRLDLRRAFVDLLRAQELIGLTESISARRKQNLELVELRYQAGREHKGALLAAQADFAQAQFDAAQAKRNVFSAQRQLAKELGQSQLALELKVRGEFRIENNQLDRPDFEMLANNSPFLQALIARKEAVRLDSQAAKAEFFPQIYFNSEYSRAQDSWPPQDDQWSAGLSVSLPLYDAGSRSAKLRKAQSRLRQAQAQQRSGFDNVIATLEQAFNDFVDAQGSVIVKNRYLDAAYERAQIAAAQYGQGLLGFDDWIIIEGNLVNAKKAYLDAQANLLIKEAEWIQAKGGRLEYAQN